MSPTHSTSSLQDFFSTSHSKGMATKGTWTFSSYAANKERWPKNWILAKEDRHTYISSHTECNTGDNEFEGFAKCNHLRTSAHIQNVTLGIMNLRGLQNATTSIHAALFLAIVVDETTDISNKEKLMCFWCMGSELGSLLGREADWIEACYWKAGAYHSRCFKSQHCHEPGHSLLHWASLQKNNIWRRGKLRKKQEKEFTKVCWLYGFMKPYYT